METKWAATNSTFAIGGVLFSANSFVIKGSSVLRTNFCAPKSASSPSPKTMCRHSAAHRESDFTVKNL